MEKRQRNHRSNHNHGHSHRNTHYEKRDKITHCERCGAELEGRFGYSIFDASCICVNCKHKETNHPDYEKAIEGHKKELQAGNHSFRGIGKPSGL